MRATKSTGKHMRLMMMISKYRRLGKMQLPHAGEKDDNAIKCF